MSHRLHRLTQISQTCAVWGIKGTRISLMTQIFELCGIRWCFILFCSSLQYRSSKINPAFFVDKASCTRQFESELSLHSLASLFPIKKGFFLPLRLSCKERLFSKTYLQQSFRPLRFPFQGTETFLTVKEGSTSHLGLLSSGEKKETALLGTVYAPPVPPLREGPYPIPKP